LRVPAVGVDLGLGGSARFIRIVGFFHFRFWRAVAAGGVLRRGARGLSLSLSVYGCGLGGMGGFWAMGLKRLGKVLLGDK
jgi:hypothetical protein